MGKKTKPRAVTASFSYADDAENQRVLTLAEHLALKDSRSRSWVIMEALKEYVKAHWPGNPQTDIRVYTEQIEGPRGRPKPVPLSAYQQAMHGPTDPREMKWSDIQFCVKTLHMTREQAVAHLKEKGYAE